MNKLFVYLTILLLGTSVMPIWAQNNSNQICRIGLQYQLSETNSWGMGKPVLITVQPGSPAAVAGLRPGDIIESIDGRPTFHLTSTQIDQMLQSPTERKLLQVTNFSNKQRKVVLARECKARSTLNERQLAKAFALYSLEDQSERRLTYPYTLHSASDFHFEQISTFAFAASTDPATSAIDDEIYQMIDRELVRMGLTKNNRNPDVIIDCFYSMEKNGLYAPKEFRDVPLTTWRYSPTTKEMVHVPYLPVGAPEQAASHTLNFGFRMLDAKDTKRILWQCSARELLSAPIAIAEYAASSVPMMLMQFPFVRYTKNPIYLIVSNKYLYTGLSYRADDLSIIADVDEGSPSFRTELEPGAKISTINGLALKDGSPATFSSGYKSFVERSMNLRDIDTQFTDAKGLASCAYWRPKDYKAVAKMINNLRYSSAFSYLFFFRPYVNTNELSSIVFGIDRSSGSPDLVIVQPVLRNESYVTLE